MKLYAPEYYKNFVCIADKCKHSCCIGWEIDIDDDALKKYEALDSRYAEKIKKSIEHGGEPHFKLCRDGRCPHLNEKGLCKIILELGEGYLCNICREHPRFYNDTPYGREVGLGIACEEACRLVLESGDYAKIVEVGELDIEADFINENDFNAIAERENVFAILSDRSFSYSQRLEKISKEYSVSADILDVSAWRELFASLEYLDADHKTCFESFSLAPEIDAKLEPYLERALAYFVYRHCTEAEDMSDFTSSLGFCLVLERMLASLAERCGAMCATDLILPARIISEELEYSEENTDIIKLEFAFR